MANRKHLEHDDLEAKFEHSTAPPDHLQPRRLHGEETQPNIGYRKPGEQVGEVEERLVSEMDALKKTEKLQEYINALPSVSRTAHGAVNERELAASFLRNKGSVMKVVDELGLGKAQVVNRLRKLGFKGERKEIPADFEKIRKMHSQGMSLRAIERRVGMDKRTVGEIVKGERTTYRGQGHRETVEPSPAHIKEALQRRERNMKLLDKVIDLPPRRKEVIETWIASGLDSVETAKKLGIAPASVRSAVRDAGMKGFELYAEYTFIPGQGLKAVK